MKKIIVLSCCFSFGAMGLFAQSNVKAGNGNNTVVLPLATVDVAPSVQVTTLDRVTLATASDIAAAPLVGTKSDTKPVAPARAVKNDKLVPVIKETPDDNIHHANDRSHPRKDQTVK